MVLDSRSRGRTEERMFQVKGEEVNKDQGEVGGEMVELE